MPIQAPKWGFGGLWTPKCDYYAVLEAMTRVYGKTTKIDPPP